jgi:pimeloyl-ACP methyl ester carboxylesterase
MLNSPLHHLSAGALEVAFHADGPPDGPPVFLMHGFPYDVHAYAEVAPRLAAQGCRVVVPYLRGFGPTRFLRRDTPRSGEQAALGHDLRQLMDALQVPRAVLAGYDWGGRAACVVAALWPERCAGLVTVNSYNLQHIARAMLPDTPENEQRLWYQYLFHSERGRAALTLDRRALCRRLWELWSPTWAFDGATFERSATAFEHPDFVDVVIHSYRHRFGLVPGDPAVAEVERRIAAQPPITVPTISFDGTADGVRPWEPAEANAHRFTGPRQHRVLPGIGHNLPQEAPRAFADAVLELVRR